MLSVTLPFTHGWSAFVPWTPTDVRECSMSICINGWLRAVNSALPAGEKLPAFLTSAKAYLHRVLWDGVRWLYLCSPKLPAPDLNHCCG